MKIDIWAVLNYNQREQHASFSDELFKIRIAHYIYIIYTYIITRGLQLCKTLNSGVCVTDRN